MHRFFWIGVSGFLGYNPSSGIAGSKGKNEGVLRELKDNMKCNNICIIGIPEGEEEQGIENLFEKVMMENFPNLMREKVTQIQEHREYQSRGTQRGPLQDPS